jgi:uncharacterized Zn-binding protein involved in type VI secretion
MPEAATLGAPHSGVGVIPPSPAAQGSPDVKIEGKAALRVGDAFADGSSVSAGAPHVFINGKAAARMGDQVSNGASIVQGAASVKIGDKGGAAFGQSAVRAALDAARERVFAGLTDPHDKLILCLPEMAERSYAQASAIDKPGWQLLFEFSSKWVDGPAYRFSNQDDSKYDNGPGEPVWAEWDWLMLYSRFRKAKDGILEQDRLFSPGAQAKLTSILMNEKCFTGEGTIFKHVTSRENWRSWRKKAFQGYSIDEFTNINIVNRFIGLIQMINLNWPLEPAVDGLSTLARVTIYALADGRTSRLPNGQWRVHINRVGLFIHDGVDFSSEDQTLGLWDCAHGFSPVYGIPLANRHFESFRARSGYGQDLRVVCDLHVVNIEEYYYDVAL